MFDYAEQNRLDVYTEEGDGLYAINLLADLGQQHFCLPSEPLSQFNMQSQLPVKLASTPREAHQFIGACRQLKQAAGLAAYTNLIHCMSH